MEKIIDLTYEIEEGMNTFNAYWHPAVRITPLGRHEFEGRESRCLTFGTHCGTHVDAPSHFVKGGLSIEKIPLSRLIGPVTILDFSGLNNNDCVTQAMIEKKSSEISLTKKVIFKFGWGKNWKTNSFYTNYPFLSREAAEYLVALGVELIATDTPSLDDSRISLQGNILGSEDDSPIHKIILRNKIILIEYVAHLEMVDDVAGWNIVAMPLKIKHGDGSPARVFLYK